MNSTSKEHDLYEAHFIFAERAHTVMIARHLILLAWYCNRPCKGGSLQVLVLDSFTMIACSVALKIDPRLDSDA